MIGIWVAGGGAPFDVLLFGWSFVWFERCPLDAESMDNDETLLAADINEAVDGGIASRSRELFRELRIRTENSISNNIIYEKKPQKRRKLKNNYIRTTQPLKPLENKNLTLTQPD